MSQATVKLFKKDAARAQATGKKAGPIRDDNTFGLFDNQDDTFTIFGLDAAGNQVDISTLATLTVTSGDPTTLSVDAPTGMTVKAHALKATVRGTPVVLTFVATWNDGSVGPFTITEPVDITGTTVGGLVIVPGTPTIRT